VKSFGENTVGICPPRRYQSLYYIRTKDKIRLRTMCSIFQSTMTHIHTWDCQAGTQSQRV